MVQLLKQSTEFYCSTEKEADELIHTRKTESLGKVVKTQVEVKENFVKVVIAEEYNSVIELQKKEQEDPNDYYDMFDGELKVLEHEERKE